MAAKQLRAALYLRVSTSGQDVANQKRELEAVAEARGWLVTAIYADEGISGSKGRDRRPQLDALLNDASKHRFDVAMIWSVDRLGRSLPDLISSMQTLHAAKVDLFLHQQNIDTTTPTGRAMFGMLAVFGEFERAMIVARVQSGMDRAKEEQAAGMVRRDKQGIKKKLIGRPRISDKTADAIKARLLAKDAGVLRIAKDAGVGVSVVQRLQKELLAA
nr:recombinase family protein [uncultured Lichenicoccus sp.]